jgi:ribosomal protein S21
MAVTRVKVTMRDLPHNASHQDREIAFRKLFSAFKKAVADAGVLHEYKKHEYYESPGEKRRRKKRESELQQLKAKLRENFPEKRKKSDKKNDKKNTTPKRNTHE